MTVGGPGPLAAGSRRFRARRLRLWRPAEGRRPGEKTASRRQAPAPEPETTRHSHGDGQGHPCSAGRQAGHGRDRGASGHLSTCSGPGGKLGTNYLLKQSAICKTAIAAIACQSAAPDIRRAAPEGPSEGGGETGGGPMARAPGGACRIVAACGKGLARGLQTPGADTGLCRTAKGQLAKALHCGRRNARIAGQCRQTGGATRQAGDKGVEPFNTRIVRFPGRGRPGACPLQRARHWPPSPVPRPPSEPRPDCRPYRPPGRTTVARR